MTWSYRRVHDERAAVFFILEDGVERALLCVLGDNPEALALRIINSLDHAPPLAGFEGQGGEFLERRRRALALRDAKLRNEGRQ